MLLTDQIKFCTSMKHAVCQKNQAMSHDFPLFQCMALKADALLDLQTRPCVALAVIPPPLYGTGPHTLGGTLRKLLGR